MDELEVIRAGLDELSGLPDRYSAKLLCVPPMRALGRISLGPILESLALMIVLVEDSEAFALVQNRLVRRVREPQPQGKVEAKAVAPANVRSWG